MRPILRGTHQGELRGISPTEMDVEVGVLGLFRIADRRLEEHWAMIDNLWPMQQLNHCPVISFHKLHPAFEYLHRF